MKPLIVGVSNPWQTDERRAMRYAMHPDPPHASGGRLCYRVMGLNEDSYLERFDRIDLCHPEWNMKQAREKAAKLVAERNQCDVLVLLGEKVASAFHPSYAKPFTPFRVIQGNPMIAAPRYVLLPHPSGLNRNFWKMPDGIERAREALLLGGALNLFPCDACARDGSSCARCGGTGRYEVGWKCGECGIETYNGEDMRRDVLRHGGTTRDGHEINLMICPLCNAEGKFVDVERSGLAAGALPIRPQRGSTRHRPQQLNAAQAR